MRLDFERRREFWRVRYVNWLLLPIVDVGSGFESLESGVPQSNKRESAHLLSGIEIKHVHHYEAVTSHSSRRAELERMRRYIQVVSRMYRVRRRLAHDAQHEREHLCQLDSRWQYR